MDKYKEKHQQTSQEELTFAGLSPDRRCTHCRPVFFLAETWFCLQRALQGACAQGRGSALGKVILGRVLQTVRFLPLDVPFIV